MNKIIGSKIGDLENHKRKNFNFYIKKIFSLIGVLRINNNVFIKNHNFVFTLSLIDDDLGKLDSNLDKNGYKFINIFSLENEEFNVFLSENKEKVLSGELLVGFLYDDLEIKNIVFAEQNFSNEKINLNIDNIKKEIYKNLEQEKIRDIRL